MPESDLKATLASLDGFDNELLDHDFLLTWNHSDRAIRTIVTLADLVESLARQNLATRVFDNGLGVAIFRDKSTRTRYAFRSGCNLLGLATEELDESTSQIAHGETVRETAAMIGFLTEVVGIRDDIFLGEGHKYMVEIGASLAESWQRGILRQRATVLNLQSDLDHPTQSLADLCHLVRHFGGFDALKGKRLAMTWAYSPSYGKPLSVPQGVVALMTRFGMDVVLAHPRGYDLEPDALDPATRFAAANGGRFAITHSMEDAFEGADIVYPKSWASAGVMRERTRLLRARESSQLAALEKQALTENAQHTNWHCDEAMMARTRGGRALYMHCLPADISGVSCERGEVSAGVFEAARLATYREAAFKPYVVAALILAMRTARPADVLRRLFETARPRVA
ncbi:MAG: knotted carbamoyltransferase YgeW [Vicinamibacterales bacterium]